MILRTLHSGFRELAALGPGGRPFAQAAIRDEPTFSAVPVERAAAEGGPIHRAFVAALPEAARQGTLLASASVWLKRGWTPGGRGLHVDQIETGADGDHDYRRRRFPGQPFYMLCAGVSRTRFVFGEVPIADLPPGSRPSLLLRGLAEELLAAGRVAARQVPDSALVAFDDEALHEAMPADETGWRILIRVFPMRRVRFDYDEATLRALRVVVNDAIVDTPTQAALLRGTP